MYTFPKSERLHHKILVDKLFAEGKSIYEYPLRLVYLPLTEVELKNSFRLDLPEGIAPLQLLITVPKKKRRHAVDRVLMRRRIRNEWRLLRRPLRQNIETAQKFRTVSVAIVYQSSENISSAEINAKIQRLISRLNSRLDPPISNIP